MRTLGRLIYLGNGCWLTSCPNNFDLGKEATLESLFKIF